MVRTVVKELLARADERVLLPATLFSVSLYRFFFLFGLCLLITMFPFDLFPFILTADPAGRALGSIHFLKKSGVLFWKRDFNINFFYILCLLPLCLKVMLQETIRDDDF